MCICVFLNISLWLLKKKCIFSVRAQSDNFFSRKVVWLPWPLFTLFIFSTSTLRNLPLFIRDIQFNVYFIFCHWRWVKNKCLCPSIVKLDVFTFCLTYNRKSMPCYNMIVQYSFCIYEMRLFNSFFCILSYLFKFY